MALLVKYIIQLLRRSAIFGCKTENKVEFPERVWDGVCFVSGYERGQSCFPDVIEQNGTFG